MIGVETTMWLVGLLARDREIGVEPTVSSARFGRINPLIGVGAMVWPVRVLAHDREIGVGAKAGRLRVVSHDPKIGLETRSRGFRIGRAMGIRGVASVVSRGGERAAVGNRKDGTGARGLPVLSGDRDGLVSLAITGTQQFREVMSRPFLSP